MSHNKRLASLFSTRTRTPRGPRAPGVFCFFCRSRFCVNSERCFCWIVFFGADCHCVVLKFTFGWRRWGKTRNVFVSQMLTTFLYRDIACRNNEDSYFLCCLIQWWECYCREILALQLCFTTNFVSKWEVFRWWCLTNPKVTSKLVKYSWWFVGRKQKCRCFVGVWWRYLGGCQNPGPQWVKQSMHFYEGTPINLLCPPVSVFRTLGRA